MILYTALRQQWQKMNQILESHQTTHISNSRANYGVSFVRILEKTDRVITTPHCICKGPGADPLTTFRSKSKFAQYLPCSGLNCALPITTKFRTHHDSYTVVITTVTLSWRVQSLFVICYTYSKLEHSKFWSNFEFDQNSVNGTGARTWSPLCL